MNKIDFSKSGGFRFKQSTLSKMQDSYYLILQTIIKHYKIPSIGNFIIAGCEINGIHITEGIFYIDGDLCFFEESEGTINSKVKKQITQESNAFKNGTNPLVYRNTIAIIDNAGIELNDFTRVAYSYNDLIDIPNGIIIDPAAGANPPVPTVLERLSLIEAMVAPIASGHGRMLWEVAWGEIPVGWAEDEEWRGRFIVGSDPTILSGGGLANPEFSSMSSEDLVPGRKDGKKGHVMTLSNLIEHEHDLNINSNSNDFGIQGFWDQSSGPNTGRKTGKTGSSTPEAIPTLPPYKTTIVIKWVGLN